jgi:hypothetical protein
MQRVRKENALYKFLQGCISKDYDSPAIGAALGVPDLLSLWIQGQVLQKKKRIKKGIKTLASKRRIIY